MITDIRISKGKSLGLTDKWFVLVTDDSQPQRMFVCNEHINTPDNSLGKLAHDCQYGWFNNLHEVCNAIERMYEFVTFSRSHEERYLEQDRAYLMRMREEKKGTYQ